MYKTDIIKPSPLLGRSNLKSKIKKLTLHLSTKGLLNQFTDRNDLPNCSSHWGVAVAVVLRTLQEILKEKNGYVVFSYISTNQLGNMGGGGSGVAPL
jgi:hypothetical protein